MHSLNEFFDIQKIIQPDQGSIFFWCLHTMHKIKVDWFPPDTEITVMHVLYPGQQWFQFQ